MKTLLLLALLLSACSRPVVGDMLTPVAEERWSLAWTVAVQEAVDVWAEALGEDCPRYEVGEGGWPVRLLPDAAWPYDDDEGGMMTNDGVDIRGSAPQQKLHVLVHELGHGIFGGWHSDDEESVMYYQVSVFRAQPTDADVARAHAALGCGS